MFLKFHLTIKYDSFHNVDGCVRTFLSDMSVSRGFSAIAGLFNVTKEKEPQTQLAAVILPSVSLSIIQRSGSS